MSTIFLKAYTAADALEESRAILRFAQSWLDATHENKPEPQEFYGFSLVLDVVSAKILHAEEQARQTDGEVII